jgi:hypothetical protein
MDLTEFENGVSNIRANTFTSRFKKVYRRSNIRLLKWIIQHKAALMNDSLSARIQLNNGEADDQLLSTILDSAPENPPIHFQSLTARDFMTWIVSLRKSDGSKPGPSACSSH